MQFLCIFCINCVRYSSFFNRVIALAQSVKIQILEAILIKYTLFAQNSIAFSTANNSASMILIHLSEFQFSAFVSALKNCTVAASIVSELFAPSVQKTIEFLTLKSDFNRSACFSTCIFIFIFFLLYSLNFSSKDFRFNRYTIRVNNSFLFMI